MFGLGSDLRHGESIVKWTWRTDGMGVKEGWGGSQISPPLHRASRLSISLSGGAILPSFSEESFAPSGGVSLGE